MKKKKRKYLAYYMWIFPWIMTRKSSFLFQQFHIFHIQVNVLPLHWKILRLPIFRETLYKDFYNKNAQRQPPRKTSHQSLYPDQFYCLTKIQSSISMFIYNILFCRRGQAAAIWCEFLNQKEQLIQPVTFPATRHKLNNRTINLFWILKQQLIWKEMPEHWDVRY